MKITPGLLVASMPGCTPARAVRFSSWLDMACVGYQINTPARVAAFLAQIGHESMSLRYASELWGPTPAQRRYEGRLDLGNTRPGDGSRYRGRGLIQTTGRGNYRRTTTWLRDLLGDTVPDFEANPATLGTDRWASWSAGAFWFWTGCNVLADAGDFDALTRRINGGTNGYADRLRRHGVAVAAVAAQQERTA